MRKAFWQSEKLRNAYRVNATLRLFSHTPVLKQLLPENVYAKSWIKSVVQVYTWFKEVVGMFLGKGIYLYLMVLVPGGLIVDKLSAKADSGSLLLHIFLFLTLLGTVLHNYLFDPSDEMFYAVFLLRMEARKYALSNYFYNLLKTFLGFLLPLILGRLLLPQLNFPFWLCPLLALFVVGAKLTAALLQVRLFRQKGRLFSGNDKDGYMAPLGVLVILLLLAAYLLPVLGLIIPWQITAGICGFFVLTGIAALVLLLRTPAAVYRPLLKHVNGELVLKKADGAEATLNTAIKEQSLKKLSMEEVDAAASSKRSGYAFFNALFVKRYRKLLSRKALRLAAVMAVLVVGTCIACLVSPSIAGTINAQWVKALPAFTFLMYMLNRGESLTQLFFFNCDSSMMSYNFYRKPEVILGIFTQRLKTVIRINLMPALVLALGLPAILYISGGTENPREYLVLFGTILAMSVFFSVHYLALYYLLQPYTLGLTQKGVMYRMATILTYMVCYFCLQVRALRENSLLFGLVVCGFTLVYIVVALVLTYKLAPKTFRLKR